MSLIKSETMDSDAKNKDVQVSEQDKVTKSLSSWTRAASVLIVALSLCTLCIFFVLEDKTTDVSSENTDIDLDIIGE